MAKAILVHDHSGIDFSPNPQEEIFFKVTGDDTDGLFDYFDLRVGYLQGFQLHIHLEQNETFHVVEGELLLRNDDEWIVAKQGDFILVPKGTVHTYVNVRRTVAHSIGLISPGGFDKFVREMRDVTIAAAGHPDPKKIEELGVKYKQRLTGPPLADVLGLNPEPAKKAAIEKELDTLHGTWTLVASEGRGETMSEEDMKKHEGFVEIDGNKMRIYVKDMHDLEGVAKFDPTATPKSIDYWHLNGPDKGKTGLGIYELQGDTLRVCWAITGEREGRPTAFSNRPDEHQAINTYKRRAR